MITCSCITPHTSTTHTGTHTISVYDGRRELLEYFVEICDPSLIRITDFNPDDTFVVGKPVTFCIDSSLSGEIQLDSITILGPKKANNKIREGDQTILGRIMSISSSSSSSQYQATPVEYSLNRLNDHKQEVRFTPQVAGKYSIDMRCLGQQVGSSSQLEIEVKNANQQQADQPAHANKNSKQSSGILKEDELLQSIVVHGISLKCLPVNSTGAFIIETNRLAQARDFDVLITDHSNNLVDVRFYRQQDGNLLAEWTPERVGK